MDVDLGDIVPIEPLHDKVGTVLTEVVTPLTERTGGAGVEDAAQAAQASASSPTGRPSSSGGETLWPRV